jgi:hypothetical protein
VSTKTPQALCIAIGQEGQKTLNEEISLPELHLPSMVHIPLCGCKIQHAGNQGVVIPGFCFPNFIKTHKFSHWLARASK